MPPPNRQTVDLTSQSSPPPPQHHSEMGQGTSHYPLPDSSSPSSSISSRPSLSSSSSPVMAVRRPKRALEADTPSDTTTAGPSTKKQKKTTVPIPGDHTTPITIDDADSTSVLEAALQKQRADQVKAQAAATLSQKLSKLQCVICMDSFTDITATACGHLFCNGCLVTALRASEVRRGYGANGRIKQSQCPVCRRNLDRNKKTDLVPLLLMKKGLGSQPRGKRAKGA